MHEHLNKRKKRGLIDFIEVPLNWGAKHKEFIGYGLESKNFFRIFYDNKYREDSFGKPKDTEAIEAKIAELKKNSFGAGIFSNHNEIQQLQKEIEFYKKYTL